MGDFMKKIFILCSGLILAPSMGWAYTCSSETEPKGSYNGSYGSSNGCSTSNTYYQVWSETVSGTTTTLYAKYITCSGCQSGYTQQTTTKTLRDCSFTYKSCHRCEPGTYKTSSGSCISCSVGTYSTTANASSCTTCPALSGAYGDSARSKAVNVANGYVTTARTGSKSINDCYIKYASYYYDTSGTFKFGGTCAYDGTVTADPCADYTYVCTNSITPSPTTALASNPSSGAACWAQANGKRAYFTTMGSNATASSSSCESSCANAISSAMKTTGSGLRVDLGCD